MNLFSVFIFSIISAVPLYANNDISYYPKYLLNMDNYFNHHIIIAEKSTHQLHLFKNIDGQPQLIKSFPMATGKMGGSKKTQGDFRTPEGVYFMSEFIPQEKLRQTLGDVGKIYGIGAFVLNYPNSVDQRDGKTGSGIWIHSTNDETRIEKGLDSRGCVVIANNDLKELSTYIELNKTLVILVHELEYVSSNTHNVAKETIKHFIQSWADSWRKKELASYLENYSEREFKDSKTSNFKKFRDYKTKLFSNEGFPEIKINDLSIIEFKGYALVTFKQQYQSSLVTDIGKKTLLLKKNEFYQWKIIEESWSNGELNLHAPLGFIPNMKYFN